jgi:hypothetical protein
VSRHPEPGASRFARGGPAGRHPGDGGMSGARPDKWGTRPQPSAPRTQGKPGPGDDGDQDGDGTKGRG